jgi:uncharacterized protein YqhQ
MAETPEKVRLGGMALQNGVLVHGPKSWACAVRLEDGSIKTAGELKKVSGQGVKIPFLRGPARLMESFVLLKDLKRALPEAKLPFERPEILGAMLLSSVFTKAIRKNEALAPMARELLASFVGTAPAVVSLVGGDTASYHGAEHIAIGSYEHGHRTTKEHERCGSHLVGPMLLGNAFAAALASRAPKEWRAPATLLGVVAATGAATESFSWMTKHPDNPISKLLAKPGYHLQHSLGTREPSPAQLEVAEAALAACLAFETATAAA